ncbi:hypothetical protein JHD47_06135 [Sulfurimonas sp. SAG-AH-194-L11]|nr:DUF2231 domain-containing protein [Sulfurimonas sp. SAG-AH-194-L11]MDF1877392.1 hypothetical protein [Sulfurimonas sp. SAG-AH-194-L11]
MMIHPATVHFAMVLPVVASALGIAYLINRQEIFSKLSSISLFFTALAMGVVWYTGSQAGPEIYDYLSEAGQHELVEHKELGLYLAISMSIIFVLKIIGCLTKKFIIEALAIVLLLIATLITFVQGKDGGEIVYNHGTPFKSYMIIDTLNETTIAVEDEEEMQAKLELYEEALEDIKLIDEELEIFYGNQEVEEEK